MIKIGEAARLLGVSVPTLRRWEETGELLPDHKSSSGTRYYDLEKLRPSKKLSLYEVPAKALLFELLRREAATDQNET